jgi:hypothetical protein
MVILKSAALFLTVAACEVGRRAMALNLLGAKKRPQHGLRPCAAGVVPDARRYKYNAATLLLPMFTPGTAFWITPFGLRQSGRVFQD